MRRHKQRRTSKETLYKYIVLLEVGTHVGARSGARKRFLIGMGIDKSVTIDGV